MGLAKHMHIADQPVSEQARYESLLRETTASYQEKLQHASDAKTAYPLCMELVNQRNRILDEMRAKRLVIPKEYQDPDYRDAHRHHT